VKKPIVKKKRFYYWVIYRIPTGFRGIEINIDVKIDSSETILGISKNLAEMHGESMRIEDILILNWKFLRRA